MRNHLAREGIEDPRVRVRRRAEDRRAGDLAGLPRRRARARRHARQRRGRRGRHAQPAHDRRDPAARSRTRRRCSRCAARSTCRCRTSRRSTSGAPRPGLSTFMNPRNSRGGDDPPARPGARRRAPAVDVVLRRSASPRGSRFDVALGGARVAARRTASASTATSSGSTPRTRSSRSAWRWQERRGALDFEIDGVVVKVDDFELQRRLGVGRARPALGDRLEVPADDRGHAAERDQLERRQVRRPAPVRRARAGPRRRRDGQGSRRCTTRRTSRARTSAPGDDVIVLRAGDVIPQVVSPAPHAVERPDRAPPPRPPERCPFCDTPTVKAEGASSPAARTATARSAAGSC